MMNDENGSWTRPAPEDGIYKIPAENLYRLQARLAKLQKKADKLVKKGLSQEQVKIGLEVVETFNVKIPVSEEHPFGGVLVFHAVKVTGTHPKIAGWEFVATLQHEGEAGTILRAVPTAALGESELAAYREAHTDCDHCRMARRRNETFLVRNVESREIKQVGRDCLGDFLGGASPEALASLAEILISMGEAASGEESLGGGHGELLSDLEDYLAFVAMVIREDGWMSRTAARESMVGRPATANVAWDNRFPPKSMV